MTSRTLRDISGLPLNSASIAQSALVMVDLQETYRRGVMRLDGVEAALVEAQAVLKRVRDAGRPVIHIVHDAGVGSPYDLTTELGQISAMVAPAPGEPVIVKNYPSSFHLTDLHDRLEGYGVKSIILAGFMTHMCINSTARQGFNLGYAPTVVANATATRSLPSPMGEGLTAHAVHAGALTAIADLFAVVVPDVYSLAA